MGLLDAIVSRSFRDESAGRVVVFNGDRRNRGFLVKSEADELKIKSFLKMYYFAHFSVLLLGMLVANSWSMFFTSIHAFQKPADHLVRTFVIAFGIYALVMGLPYLFLWRAYKKSIFNFVSAQDEVTVSGYGQAHQKQTIVAGFVMIACLIMGIALFFLVRAK
jgi:hypothetical protein